MAVDRSAPNGLLGSCRRSSGVLLLALPFCLVALVALGEGVQDPPKSRSQEPKSDLAPTLAPIVPPPIVGELEIRIADGPNDGMTLERAIDRFLKENLEFRALHDEIVMAQADIEAAGQPPRSDLFIRVGAGGFHARVIQNRELVPRRWIETLVARASMRVLEAQYEDAVRSRRDELYTAFLGVESAQVAVNYAKAALRGMQSLFKSSKGLWKQDIIDQAAMASMHSQLDHAELASEEANTTLRKHKLILANLLNLPDAEIDSLRVSIDDLDRIPDVPPVEELIRIASIHRADLRAQRLGLQRARLGWLKALVEPLSQIIVRPWPNVGDETKPRLAGFAPSWSRSVLITLPAPVRNRGALKRAAINIRQTRTELAKVELEVVRDVRRARLEYEQSRSTVERFRRDILPNARTARNHEFQLMAKGEKSLTEYLQVQGDFNTELSQYLTAASRLRRSTLALNTAIGDKSVP